MAMYVGTPQVCPVPAEARRGCWIPFRTRVTGYWEQPAWVLGAELRSTTRAAHPLNL